MIYQLNQPEMSGTLQTKQGLLKPISSSEHRNGRRDSLRTLNLSNTRPVLHGVNKEGRQRVWIQGDVMASSGLDVPANSRRIAAASCAKHFS